MKLKERIRLNQTLRILGIDDAPFSKRTVEPVLVSGILCSNTRFQGMLRTYIHKDGMEATQALITMISQSKYLAQIHAVLLDGMTLGGFNVVDVPLLAATLQKPCISVMRRSPNLEAIQEALQNLSHPEQRWRLFQESGPVHSRTPFFFQCYQCDPDTAGALLKYVTLQGHVPEPLRMAHLINSAMILGQSNNKA